MLPSVLVDTDRSADRFSAQNLSRIPDSAPTLTSAGTVVPPEVDAGPSLRSREGRGATEMAGKRQESAELGGHQKVWGERTAGIETGCSRVGSKCWRRNSEGGKQKDAETERETQMDKRREEKQGHGETYTENKTRSGLGESTGPKPR